MAKLRSSAQLFYQSLGAEKEWVLSERTLKCALENGDLLRMGKVVPVEIGDGEVLAEVVVSYVEEADRTYVETCDPEEPKPVFQDKPQDTLMQYLKSSFINWQAERDQNRYRTQIEENRRLREALRKKRLLTYDEYHDLLTASTDTLFETETPAKRSFHS